MDWVLKKSFQQMEWQAAWLCRAVTCIDLTTLSGDDTESNVDRLFLKAAKPIRQLKLFKILTDHTHILNSSSGVK